MRLLMMIGVTAMVAASAALAAPEDELMATPQAFVGDLVEGKVDTAAALMTADATVLDEHVPYVWSGRDAFKRWLADDAASSAAAHITGRKLKLGKPVVAAVTGDAAYVVAAASETYRQDDVRTAESARMVFALRREGRSWKIASWAWTGRKPHPVVKSS